MTERTKLLGEEKMSKTLLIMGIPTMIGMLVSALYNIVDTYWVGRLGTLATAAVSVVYPLSYVGMFFGLVFGCGANSVIARKLGQKEIEEVRKYSSTAVYLGLAFIITSIVVMLAGIDAILAGLGALPAYLDMAKAYGVIFIIGLLFNVFNMCMNNMIVAEGNSFVSMAAMFVGAIINIVLDPVLIFTLDLGIRGAAYATLISRMVSTVIYLVYVLSKKSVLSVNPSDIKIDGEHIKEILKIGLPIAIYQLITGIAITIVNTLAKAYGADAQAALGIVNKIMMIEMSAIFGFFKGYSPVVGYNFGAGRMDRVKEATKIGLIWSTLTTMILGVIFMVFRGSIVHMFNKESADVLVIGSFALVVYAISYFTYGLQIIIGNYFLAIGEAKRGGLTSMGKGLLYIVLLFVMNAILGLDGLIFAQLVTDVVGTVITIVVYNLFERNNSELAVVNA